MAASEPARSSRGSEIELDPAATEAALRTNYSTTGVAVMQALYSDDYLSIGGLESTDLLAGEAGITNDHKVLDIGCGIGGPMLRLASHLGCRVTGIDLVGTSIEEARRRAEHRHLDNLTTFEEGDATALSFADDTFDVVWGQDAWCHVPDKATLLSEAARVLKPGGTIAFTDWLRGTGMSDVDRQKVLSAAVSEAAITGPEYRQLLAASGFRSVEFVDISDVFIAQYTEICDRLAKGRDAVVKQFNERIYDIVSETNRTILGGFQAGGMGGGKFIGRLSG